MPRFIDLGRTAYRLSPYTRFESTAEGYARNRAAFAETGAATLAEGPLYGTALADLYKVGKDIWSRKTVDKSKYELWKPKMKRPGDSSQMRRIRPRTTNRNVPAQQRMSGGNIQIGDKANYTVSSNVARAVSGRRISLYNLVMRNALKTNLYRWQSIRPYGGDATSTTQDARSLYLDVIGQDATVGATTGVGVLHLPMYAFDLTTLPGNQYMAGSKTSYKLESVPCYRLHKHTTSVATVGPDASLSNTTHNYVWEAQNGMNNGPSEYFANSCDYLWSNEVLESSQRDYMSYKSNYTAVDLLLKCTRYWPCKVHISLVKFHNHAGPQRWYCDSQPYNKDANMTIVTQDSNDINTRSDRDTFWESFWDDKVCHPLSSFKAPKRGNYIQFLRDKVITVNPETDAEIQPYTHKYSLVVKDGGWHDLIDPQYSDHTMDGQNGELGPVVGNYVGTTWEFGNAHGFNTLIKGEEYPRLYDPSDASRESTVYLLVWMENGIPPDYRPKIYDADIKVTRPVGTNSLPINGDCCSFDIRVRKSVTVVPKPLYV